MLKMHAMNVLPETVFTWSESTKRSFGLCLRPLSFPCMASNYSLSSCIALDSLSFQSSSRSGTNPYAGLHLQSGSTDAADVPFGKFIILRYILQSF